MQFVGSSVDFRDYVPLLCFALWMSVIRCVRCVRCNVLGALWMSVITFLCFVLLYSPVVQ